MKLLAWLQGLFVNPDDEAAEREEYGLPDAGEDDLEEVRLGSRFAPSEGAEAAEDDLDELEPPPDPDP
jgi:hypothetical protein